MINKKFEKIGIFVVVILIIVASVLTIFPTKKIEFEEEIPLDYDYIWNLTENISDVVYDAYNETDIPKGRAWGTKGEYFTANNILMPNMTEICKLDNVHNISIEYLDKQGYYDREYSSKIETDSFSLEIKNASNNGDSHYVPIVESKNEWSPILPYKVPISECFPVPTGIEHYEENTLNCTYWINNTRLITLNIFFKEYSEYHYNISIQFENYPSLIVGQPLFINNVSEIPEDQEGIIVIVEDKQGVQNIIENLDQPIDDMTLPPTLVIIKDDLELKYASVETYDFLVSTVTSSDENISKIISLLKNDTTMIAGNIENNETLTFLYNFNQSKGIFSDFVFAFKNKQSLDWFGSWKGWGITKTFAKFFYNNFNKKPLLPDCKAMIFCDYNDDAHFMGYATKNWGFHSKSYQDGPYLPIFSINNSLGSYLINNRKDIVISGHLEQRFSKQTIDTPGVPSFNVVGYRNVSNSPSDSTIVISNRYDGWWGQTPGDSGAGAAIVLGIGKYIADNNISLKHNLLFLFTTGEEYGKRGAHHYVDSHKNEGYNYFLWIGLDQLAFNHSDTGLILTPQYSNEKHKGIIEDLAEQTRYEENTGYGFETKWIDRNDPKSGSEDDIWLNFSDTIDTICFVKHGTKKLLYRTTWTGYHRAGMNYEEGDSMNYIDQNDLNATALLVLETVLHFAQKEKYEPDFIIISFIIVVIVILLALLIYQKVKTKF